MEAIKEYIQEMYNKIIHSRPFLAVTSFTKKYVTPTDFVMGSLLIGGLFMKRPVLGCNYFFTKVSTFYFVSKAGLGCVKHYYPSFYAELVHSRSLFFTRVCSMIIPEDYLTCYNVIKSILDPYLSKFDNFSAFALLGGIYKASTTQKPIKLSKKPITEKQADLFHYASLYCELATGMYGSAMVYGLMGEIDSTGDVKRLISGKKNKDGYKEAFTDHCHIQPSDILYVNWGCENDENAETMVTASGMKITSPPYFLIRHEATKSIVLCIRGTWDIKDFITDFKCNAMPWGSGKAHEGIALVANAMLNDEELNKAIETSLNENADYQLVAVGHSLGAGIAALLTINWRFNKLYNKPVCFAFAPPPCLSSSVWDKGVGYVYSFVNEDDIVPRLSKDGILDAIHLIIDNCHEKKNWFHHAKDHIIETYKSMFGDSSDILNMYLPGTVYYLHPCIDHYKEYENKKRFILNTESSSTMKRIENALTRVTGTAGGVIYKKGSDFPNTIIISPMVLFHHFVYNYEELIKQISNNISDSSEVRVDIPSE